MYYVYTSLNICHYRFIASLVALYEWQAVQDSSTDLYCTIALEWLQLTTIVIVNLFRFQHVGADCNHLYCCCLWCYVFTLLLFYVLSKEIGNLKNLKPWIKIVDISDKINLTVYYGLRQYVFVVFDYVWYFNVASEFNFI